MSSVPANVLVPGLGNDILSDDAVGLWVAQAVRSRLAGAAGIDVKEATAMELALLDETSGHASVVLVNSAQMRRAPPERIHQLGPGRLAGIRSASPHFLGVEETLAAGELLGLAMPRQVCIFALEVADAFTLGAGLTPTVAAAVPATAEQIVKRARELARRPPPVAAPAELISTGRRARFD